MDAALRRLQKKIRTGRTALFIGAGASAAAGAPTGAALADLLAREFLGSEEATPTEDFVATCTRVLSTPGVDRADVDEFISAQLRVQPCHAHLDLTKVRWSALFTTNYDDLLEQAYRQSVAPAQHVDPVYSRRFAVSSARNTKRVPLFRLMGCVNARDPQSYMVLTRADYNRKLRDRSNLLGVVSDFVKDGTICYIGYSFQDQLLWDILDEVMSEVGISRLPWGWALSVAEWDDDVALRLAQYRVMPLKMSFEDFVEWVSEDSATIVVPQEPPKYMTCQGVSVEIDASRATMYTQQFEFMHDDIATPTEAQDTAPIRAFLETGAHKWRGIASGWVFRRSLLSTVIDKLRTSLEESTGSTIPVFALLGPAGAGKSLLAATAAYELFRHAGYPCIVIRPERERLDYQVIDSFIRHAADTVRQEKALPAPLGTLIIVDDAATRIQDVRQMQRYLAARGVRAVILAVARENEWLTLEGGDGGIRVPDVTRLLLPDQLSHEEQADLLWHLRHLDILKTAQTDEYWLERISDRWECSFLTTLYMLVEPTRPPLERSIGDELARLKPIAKSAYKRVCVVNQFGLSVNMELLVRSMGTTYDEFIDGVYDQQSRGVIVEDETEQHEILFRARSRLVAERVVACAYATAAEWAEELKTLVGCVEPHNTTEVGIVRALLVRHLGSNALRPPGLSPDDVLAVFEAVLDAGMVDSATLHHYALVLVDQGDLDTAERYIRQALDVLRDDGELSHFRTETEQNLLNSLGMVHARHGLRYEAQGRPDQAKTAFEEAVSLFRRARQGEFPNAYPYYSEAWMLFRRAENRERFSRVSLLAAALAVMDEAEGNVSDDDLSTLAELRARIVASFAEIQQLDEILASVEDKPKEAPVVAYVRATLASAPGSPRTEVTNAYEILRAALAKTPGHEACLRLLSRLHIRLSPQDWAGWWKVLQQRVSVQDVERDLSLLFDLGWCACQLGNYAQAMVYLDVLERESQQHRSRSGIRKVIRDGEQGREFRGRVTTIESKLDGWVDCEEFGKELKFARLRQEFTPVQDQLVTYHVALNYRGPMAISLRPLA